MSQKRQKGLILAGSEICRYNTYLQISENVLAHEYNIMYSGGFLVNQDLSECKLPEDVQTAWNEVNKNKVGVSCIPVLYCG